MISLVRRLAAAGLALALTGCAGSVVQGSGARARPGEPGSVGLGVRWKKAVGGGIGDRQLAGGSADASHVYVNDDSGTVTALDARTGGVAWTTRAGTRTGTPVGAAGGVVFYYDSNAGLTTLDGRTGATLWKGGPLGGDSSIAARPAYAGGVVAMPVEQGYTDGLGGRDVHTGKVRWLVHYTGYVLDVTAPVVTAGTIFAARRPADSTGAPSLLAVSPASGRVLWTAALPGVGHYDELSLIPAGDTVIVETQRDSDAPATLTAFDVRTHARRWTSSVSGVEIGGTDVPAVVADGTAVFGTLQGLRGVSVSTGKLLYTEKLDGGPAGRPGLCGGQACSVGIRVLTVVDGTGRSIGEYTEPDDPGSASAEPMLAGAGHTYLVNDTYVYALG